LLTWRVTNLLLLVSIFAVFYAIAWESSTRRYLKGFSDAVIPAGASTEEKIQAILDWMSHGPARLRSSFAAARQDRDPTETLNYDSLLRVCGTATNAFINLANSAGLPSRRLLLLNANQGAKHVDAEVLVDGRWIIVDPAFRVILRTPDGNTLTTEQLMAPAIFLAATQNIPGYDPSYDFARTTHVRTARLGLIGTSVQKLLDFLLPKWQDSVAISLWSASPWPRLLQ
jgi:transglutaminase-like putative cysteine protease